MKIDISQLQKGFGTLDLETKSEEYHELTDIGIVGPVNLKAQIVPVENKYWIKGSVTGSIKQECTRCTSDILCKFSVDLKILVEFGKNKAIEWDSEDELNFDEYSIKIGPNNANFLVIEQIREQILLNCNIMNPSENLTVPECTSCKPVHKDLSRQNSQTDIDPRWEKLKDLL